MIVPDKPDQFEYVIIPCDSLYPIEARTYPQVELDNDQFIKMLKGYFAASSPESGVDRNLLMSQLNFHAKKDISSSIDSATMDQLLSITSVDILTVAVPSKENGYIGISLYCDDKGKSKKLAINERATKLGLACGLAGHTLNGDVFISRMFDDGEENWFRMNFGLSDVSSSADWIKTVAAQMTKKLSSGPASLSGLAANFLKTPETELSNSAIMDTNYNETSADYAFGKGDNYKWTQSAEDVEVVLTLEDPVSSTRDIKVEIKPKSVFAVVNGQIVLGPINLLNEVVPDDSTWSYVRSDKIIIITLWKRKSKVNWDRLY